MLIYSKKVWHALWTYIITTVITTIILKLVWPSAMSLVGFTSAGIRAHSSAAWLMQHSPTFVISFLQHTAAKGLPDIGALSTGSVFGGFLGWLASYLTKFKRVEGCDHTGERKVVYCDHCKCNVCRFCVVSTHKYHAFSNMFILEDDNNNNNNNNIDININDNSNVNSITNYNNNNNVNSNFEDNNYNNNSESTTPTMSPPTTSTSKLSSIINTLSPKNIYDSVSTTMLTFPKQSNQIEMLEDLGSTVTNSISNSINMSDGYDDESYTYINNNSNNNNNSLIQTISNPLLQRVWNSVK